MADNRFTGNELAQGTGTKKSTVRSANLRRINHLSATAFRPMEDSKRFAIILGARRQDRKGRKVIFVMCWRPPPGPERLTFCPDDVPIGKRLPFPVAVWNVRVADALTERERCGRTAVAGVEEIQQGGRRKLVDCYRNRKGNDSQQFILISIREIHRRGIFLIEGADVDG